MELTDQIYKGTSSNGEVVTWEHQKTITDVSAICKEPDALVKGKVYTTRQLYLA